jgi:hypothetical protein
MDDNHSPVGQLDIRQEAFVAPQDAAVGEGRQVQGLPR